MIQADKRQKERGNAHWYDHDAQKPENYREFHAFIWFLDGSHLLWSRLFALNREHAFSQIFTKMWDSTEYIANISLAEDGDD